jgi:uncharacterized membrane protein YeiH
MTQLLEVLGYFGVFVFAISGSLAAVRKDMDLFGVLAIAFLPALGGGTMRDLILDVPVFWIGAPLNVWLIVTAALLVFFMSRFVESRQKVLIWADAIGLSLFAVVGTQVAWLASHSYVIAIVMGVTTAVVGGLIRDVVCNEVPLVMQKGEVYATAAFAGAGCYCLMTWASLPAMAILWTSVLVTFGVRAMGIVFGLSLPIAKR